MWVELAGSRAGAARGISEACGHGGSSSTLEELPRARRSCRSVCRNDTLISFFFFFKQPTDGFSPGNYLVVTTDVDSR